MIEMNTGKGRHRRGCRLALGAALSVLALAFAGAAAERSATIRIHDRELRGARVSMKDVAVWKVTDLGSHRPAELPVAEIVSIRAPRISGTCEVMFGTVELRNGGSVEIRGDLRDIFEIPVHSIKVTIVDTLGGRSIEESIPCDGWRHMDFGGPASP